MKRFPESAKASLPEADWRGLELGLRWCYEGAPLNANGRAIGVNLCAWHLLAGEAEVEAEGLTVRARAGDWLVCRPGERVQRFSDSARIVSIHLAVACVAEEAGWVGPAALRLAADAGLARAAGRLGRARALRGLARGERRELGARRFALEDTLELRELTSGFLRRLLAVLEPHGLRFAPAEIHDERVRASRRRLAEAELREPWSREALAAGQGVSPSQLDRLWRRELGMTPREFWERRRLAAACARLQGGDCRIKALAYELGFGHLTWFSSWFRERTGVSPRQFRNRNPGA